MGKVTEKLRIAPVSDRATFPERRSPGAAGFDINSLDDGQIRPGEYKSIDTGLQVSITENHAGMIVINSYMAREVITKVA